LDVSRPTLNKYRQKFSLNEVTVKGEVRIDKLDLLQKVYFPASGVEARLSFVDSIEFRVEECEVAPNIFDMRLIRDVDSYGAICLLCCLKSRMRERQTIYLLTDKNPASMYLRDIRFFREAARLDSANIQFAGELLGELDDQPGDVILPLHVIGYKGREKAVLSEIYDKLRQQGFSEDLCASLGWTLGELADNATTHAHGVCYFMLSSHLNAQKLLTLTIGDTGIGIQSSLRNNPKYAGLDDRRALVWSFKSDVSSWDDQHHRGRGLNDLIGIAKGNRASVRSESGGLGLTFDFRDDRSDVGFMIPGTGAPGTRYSVTLIDSNFEFVSRSDVDAMLDNFLESL
jgi:hypothetical protein